MQKITAFSLIFLLLLLFPLGSYGQTPSIGAQSAILMAEDGRVLYEKSADLRLPMASTTKIMTAIVALEQNDPETLFTVPKEAVGVEGSSCYLKEGEVLSLHSLVYALMLQSANDAAAAIATCTAGSIEEFALLMNLKAAELGLDNTHFENPHGLDSEGHYTTSRDLAKLALYCMENELFSQIWATSHISIPLYENEETTPRQLYNHNKLLRSYENCVGGKTGYTMRCGRCLVSAAEENGMTLVAVTLNDRSDWADHVLLYKYGFDKKESSLWKKSDFKNISPTAD